MQRVSLTLVPLKDRIIIMHVLIHISKTFGHQRRYKFVELGPYVSLRPNRLKHNVWTCTSFAALRNSWIHRKIKYEFYFIFEHNRVCVVFSRCPGHPNSIPVTWFYQPHFKTLAFVWAGYGYGEFEEKAHRERGLKDFVWVTVADVRRYEYGWRTNNLVL